MWIPASHVWNRNERRQVILHQINIELKKHQPEWNRRNLASNLRFPKPCFTTVQWGILCTYPLTALSSAMRYKFLNQGWATDTIICHIPLEMTHIQKYLLRLIPLSVSAPWGLPYERVGDCRRKSWIKSLKKPEETNLGVIRASFIERGALIWVKKKKEIREERKAGRASKACNSPSPPHHFAYAVWIHHWPNKKR